MKKQLKILSSATAVAAMLLAASCGTPKQAAQTTTDTNTSASQTEQALPKSTADASAEFISLNDVFDIVGGKQDTTAVMKKYNYREASPYAVQRLDTYNRMFYKACTLPKRSATGTYADFPRPQRKGTSSWVGFKDDITIGVFNNKAYQNLKDQVLSAGFTLTRDGYEAEYTNGNYNVFFMDALRTVRIAKAL